MSKQELIKLQKKLRTDEKIGATVGVTRQAIFQLRKKLGVSSMITEVPGRNKKIIAAYDKGIAVVELVKLFGISMSQLYRIVNVVKKRVKKRRQERK